MDRYNDFYKKQIEELKSKGSYRRLLNIDSKDKKYISVEGNRMLNLSSNDYLGLSTDKELMNQFYNKLEEGNIITDFNLGATSSRLLTGNNHLYDKLEKELARQYGSETALVFNSGYHANIGILPALLDKGDLILSDKFDHASIIDGIRLADADFIRYKHLDYDHLERILDKKREQYNKVAIVTESLFSMDGDIADLKRLVDIKKKYDTMLYIDEAHAVGVTGDEGLGVCEAQSAIDDVDIIVGTFGKAFAGQGAFAILSDLLKEVLINKMRSFIFTTALPPVILNWNLFVAERLRSFADRRYKLADISNKLRDVFTEKGFDIKGSSSNIIPVVVGDNDKAIELAEELRSKGFIVMPIRPPTVPQNTSRLRISLTSNIDWEDIEMLPQIISERL